MSIAMARKQTYIPRRQDVLIKRRFEIRGVSEAEVIRQAIGREIRRDLPGLTPDIASAWEELMQFVEARQRLAGMGEPRRWNREELNEERESRWIRADETDAQ